MGYRLDVCRAGPGKKKRRGWPKLERKKRGEREQALGQSSEEIKRALQDDPNWGKRGANWASGLDLSDGLIQLHFFFLLSCTLQSDPALALV